MNIAKSVVMLILVVLSSQTSAEPVSRVYSGVFSNILKLGGDTDAAALFVTGDTFTLTLAYDTDAPLTGSSSTDAQYGGAGTIDVQFSNGYSAGLTNQTITVKNNGVIGSNNTWDQMSISGAPSYGAPVGSAALVSVNFTLSETLTGTVLASTDLIPVPSVNLFTSLRRIELVFQQGGATNFVRGTITAETIPDPTPVLACLGFQPPVSNSVVKVKKNRAIPFKAQLIDGAGQYADDMLVSAFPVAQVLFDDGVNSAIDVSAYALATGAGSDGNQFEFLDGTWQYNLKTSKFTAKGTYTVTLQSGDTGTYIVGPVCVGQFVIE